MAAPRSLLFPIEPRGASILPVFVKDFRQLPISTARTVLHALCQNTPSSLQNAQVQWAGSPASELSLG